MFYKNFKSIYSIYIYINSIFYFTKKFFIDWDLRKNRDFMILKCVPKIFQKNKKLKILPRILQTWKIDVL